MGKVGLVSLIEDQPDIMLCETGYPGQLSPDVIILDHHTYLENQANTDLPKHKILILARNYARSDIEQAIKSGIKGYISYECEREEVLTAIRNIAKGQRFYCSSVLNTILEEPLEEHYPLSPRENEVMQLIVDGNSSYQIAEKLNLSIHTINSHRKNILQKLNLKSPTQLIIYALEHCRMNPK